MNQRSPVTRFAAVIRARQPILMCYTFGMDYSFIEHPLKPYYDADSRILILGSFPSVKTRESGFFYGHPQNRFWKLAALLFKDSVPGTNPEKMDFLKRHHIAMYDVIYSCEIKGSSDASIRNVTPADLRPILANAPVRQIFVNGKTAEKMFIRYQEPILHKKAVCLPSTSPANAAWSLTRLAESWQVIREAAGETGDTFYD